jgi:hypothetical protein
MPTEDGFEPDHPLPLFLSRHADEDEPRGTSRILKAGILAIAVMASGVAITLSLGNPLKVFADATASLTDDSAIQHDANQSAPAIQSAAEAQPIQAPADAQLSAPVRDEIAAVAEPADQARTETNEVSSEALFRQFQAWAAKGAANGDAGAQKPVEAAQAAPAQVEENDPATAQPVQTHRKARSAQNARAEIRHVQKPKAKVQREQIARRQAPTAQDARAQEQPAQNAPAQSAQAPSFLQALGLHQ